MAGAGDPVRLRALLPDDAAPARALVRDGVGGTPYEEALVEHLAAALAATTDESRGLVAERAGEVVGLCLYGRVAGARGAAELHLVMVTASARLAGVGRALCDHAAGIVAGEGARLLVAEAPDDPALAAAGALLRSAGFREEGRVPDYYRDGVALVLYRRDLAS